MNTRRFPRTLNDAFPFGAEYGCAIERSSRGQSGLFDAIAGGLWAAAVVAVAWILLGVMQ